MLSSRSPTPSPAGSGVPSSRSLSHPYLSRMCLPYPSLSPARPSSDEEEGERQSPPLEVSDGEADGLDTFNLAKLKYFTNQPSQN